jgi:MFS family permease
MHTSSFLALCAAVFAAAFGYTAVMPLLPELLSPLMPQAPPLRLASHAGAYAAAYMVAVVVFSPAWGAASDRYGAKAVIAIGLAGSAAAVLASSFADAMWSAYAGRTVQGAFASAVLPVATAALAKVPDTAERARKVAGLGAASLLGFFAAPALSAAAVSFLAADPVATVLYASGLVALAALAIVAVMLSRAPEGSSEVAVAAERSLPWRFLALNLLAYLGLGAFEVALPLAARGPLAIDAAQVSLLFVECSLVMLAAQGALMWAAPYRARFEQALVLVIVVYAAGLLVLSGAGSMSGAIAGVGLIAASAGLVLPMVAYLATLEIGARPGAALGALTAAGGLGQAIGSASGGALYGYAGTGMFTATAFAVALGAWLASRACAPRWLGGGSRRMRL